MYFPTGIARSLYNYQDNPQLFISISPNTRKTLFLTLTATSVDIWRIRPPAILASLSRTQTSLDDHGNNAAASWAPDGTRIVIQTSRSHLVLLRVQKIPAATPYSSASIGQAAERRFLPGPGEAQAVPGYRLVLEGVVRIDGDLLCVSPRNTHILFSTRDPSAVQRIPWPTAPNADDDEGDTAAVPHNKWLGHDTWLLEEDELPWLLRSDVSILGVSYSKSTSVEGWITSDGRAYFVYLFEEDDESPPSVNLNVSEPGSLSTQHHDTIGTSIEQDDEDLDGGVLNWSGTCIHGSRLDVPSNSTAEAVTSLDTPPPPPPLDPLEHATAMAINAKFSVIAVGLQSGSIQLSNFPLNGIAPQCTQTLIPPSDQRHHRRTGAGIGVGAVRAMEWTSDGNALAVGWEHGWAVWTVSGKCVASDVDVEGDVKQESFEDAFMGGVTNLFWIPGNLELFVLARVSASRASHQLFALPFVKSAVTSQHSPDNTRYAVLQADDKVMIYRGADQPDMSVINPESDVWQHVKIPLIYMAMNWPIRYASISNDGRLLAVAGKRGLMHWSAVSGRWKSFADPSQEAGFSVRGGLIWFNHVLVAAVEASRSYQVRLYSRDLDLAAQNVLHRETFTAPVVLLSLVDNSLLVYTADNTLFHFLILPTQETVTLHLCGSISFDGVVAVPSAVRSMSWMVPPAQKKLGDPMDDLTVATILLLVGGRLVLLRPRKIGSHEVKYDMQILADKIEFCWIHLGGIGALENSLWGYDGSGVRIWLDALTIEAASVDLALDAYQSVQESVKIPLDFYPLSVLMDKGVVIGVEHEAATRTSLPFAMFRTVTSTHLFIHHILRYHLGRSQVKEAVEFASNYERLVFFAHALEILLHTVLESESGLDVWVSPDQAAPTPDERGDLLPLAIEFLDHFDTALDVVVGCARKTEMTRWRRLFDIVGNPKSLFETCLTSNLLRTAGSYLLVLHNLEQLDESNADAVRLLRRAVSAQDWMLCRELMHFLRSIDDSGIALSQALKQVGLGSNGLEDGIEDMGLQ